MKKVVYTLALKGYPSEMTILTFPWIEHYAKKIGADFQVISERKFPDWPPTFEKHQLWELGQKNDWTIFIDGDALINPELFDITAAVSKDTVIYTGLDMSAMRFRPNAWTRRDQRFIGACTWFVACSDETIDLWRPLDKDFLVMLGKEPSDDPKVLLDAIIGEIFPTNGERNCRIGDGSKAITSDKLIEDYTTSMNIARFGLKHLTIEGHLKQRFGRMYDSYYWHQYTIGVDEKILQCLRVMNDWGLVTEEAQEKYGELLKKIQAQPQQPGPGMMGMDPRLMMRRPI